MTSSPKPTDVKPNSFSVSRKKKIDKTRTSTMEKPDADEGV
jgi:hypothetical protein